MMNVCNPTPQEEAASILALAGNDEAAALGFLERQLFVIYNRAQVLVSLSGVVITVTGFSGRLIAATNLAGQITLVAGLLLVLLSAAYVYARVMRVTWITRQLTCGPVDHAIEGIIELRNAKTAAYTRGGYVLFAGLLLYGVAISIMLLNPGPVDLPIR